MSNIDLTIEICGMSGDGTIAAGGMLNEALAGMGFSIMAFDSYPAEIRGFGRCVTRTRIGDEELLALSEQTHVLISLDDEQSLSRLPLLAEGAMVFFDNRPPFLVEEGKTLAAHVEPDVDLIGIPFGDLASRAAGTSRGRNLTALGSLARVLGIPADAFHGVIEKKFAAKGGKVLQTNLKSFEAGYDYVSHNLRQRITNQLGAKEVKGDNRVLLSGNVAIARGALDAGLKLYFGYPITPATPIMEYMARELPARGGRVVQMEDEISSVGAVLGSFFAGRRAMTATSGPGLALMTELITHGVMAEIPAVILDAQRAGPSTGMPTKTEQSDLQHAVFGGAGDSARIVIAPTNVAECYEYTLRSFQLAEKYQVPVIVLTDFFLDNRVEDIRPPAASAENIQDWNVYPGEAPPEGYKRYELTDSGISPRAVPGMAGYIFGATGLEHTEKGQPDYTPDNHMKMSAKRHRKIRLALKDLFPPLAFFSENNLELGVIAWGSTFGAALEAVKQARRKGIEAGALKITTLFPFHEKTIRDFMGKCREVLIPELNYEGQLANLIGYLFKKDVTRLNKATGTPMTASVILEKMEELL